MSKGEGKKIAVKFTQPLISEFIGIVYNQPIEMDVSLLTASTNATNLFRLLSDSEGLGWPYAYRTVNTWFEINFASPIELTEISLTSSTGGYYPTWTLQGWNGSAWVDIVAGTHTATNQDKTYSFVAVEYQKIRILSGGTRSGNYPGYYNLRLKGNFVDYLNKAAFAISGKEYKYVNGPLLDKNFEVISVEAHPIEAKTILIEVNNFTRFHNAEGPLTVAYDAQKGNLLGLGGAVASFERTFTPTDLAPEPNPHRQETVNAVISNVTFNYDLVSYIDAESTEQNTVVVHPAAVTVSYTKIDIEIP